MAVKTIASFLFSKVIADSIWVIVYYNNKLTHVFNELMYKKRRIEIHLFKFVLFILFNFSTKWK